jgi:predicted negative regulator of RcsB-dependent stress response
MIYFDGQLLSASLDVCLQLLALELLLSAAVHRHVGVRSATPEGVGDPFRASTVLRSGSSLRWWAAGFVIGLSAINRGAILLLLPFLVIWIRGVLRRNWAIGPYATVQMSGRSATHAITAALLPTCVLVGLVVLHNVRVDSRASGGRMGPLPVAHNMGINFYLGNHWSLREINKTGHPQHFSHYDEIMMLPEQAGVSGAFAASQFLFRRTLEDIAADPGQWLRLMLVKVGELGHGAEIPRSANLYAVRSHSAVLAILLWKNIIAFPSGVIIPLGMVGMALAVCGWRGHWLPLAMALTQFVFVLMFFVTARYRLPAMPLMMLYGVFAVGQIAGALRTRAWGRGAALVAAVIVLGAACNWRIAGGAEEHGYYEYALLAQVHDQAGRLDVAIENYEEALRLNPDYAWAHLQLGAALLRRGDLRLAEKRLRRGIDLEPHSPNVPIARLNLGRVLARQRQLREAVEVWEAALAQDSNVPLVHAELCDALHRLGRAREAEPHCTAAAEAAAHRMRGD